MKEHAVKFDSLSLQKQLGVNPDAFQKVLAKEQVLANHVGGY